MAKFRKVEISIGRSKRGGYGQYTIYAKYRGKEIKVHTTDSEAFDWLEDDSNKELHQQAKRHCYSAIVRAYENQKQ